MAGPRATSQRNFACLARVDGPRALSRARGAARAPSCAGCAGFSLIDLLVSMAVITVLIGLLMPSLTSVRETARRVVCASNVRQHGLGIAMYAADSGGFLPQSKYGNAARAGTYSPNRMTMLRTDDTPAAWDGLGVLYRLEYLEAPGVFYCPSHRGQARLADFASVWTSDSGAIESNYQFRGGIGIRLDSLQDEKAMVTDALRSQVDFSHQVGSNVLKGDFGVGWFNDPARQVSVGLPLDGRDSDAGPRVDQAWQAIDDALRYAR